jgi:hypothetical protein
MGTFDRETLMRDPVAHSFTFGALPEGFADSAGERLAVLRFLADLEQLWLSPDGDPQGARDRQIWLTNVRAALWLKAQTSIAGPAGQTPSGSARLSDPSAHSTGSGPSGMRYSSLPSSSLSSDAGQSHPQGQGPMSLSSVAHRAGTSTQTISYGGEGAANDFTWSGLADLALPVCRALQPLARRDAVGVRAEKVQFTCIFVPYPRAQQVIDSLFPSVRMPPTGAPSTASNPLDIFNASWIHAGLSELMDRIRALADQRLASALLLMVDTAIRLYQAAAMVPDLVWYQPGPSPVSGVTMAADDVRDTVMRLFVLRLKDLLNRLQESDSSLAADLLKADEVLRSVVPGGFLDGEEPTPRQDWWLVDTWWARRLEAQLKMIEQVLSSSAASPQIWSRIIPDDQRIAWQESIKPIGVQTPDAAAGRVLAVLRLGVPTGASHHGLPALRSRILYGGQLR